jgi:hypothetical protein
MLNITKIVLLATGILLIVYSLISSDNNLEHFITFLATGLSLFCAGGMVAIIQLNKK